jgi:imidazole glycerol phosphate synthase subunit HisF
VLKKRIIAVLLFRDGVLTRTKHFRPDYIYTKNQVDTSSVDELVCIDLGGSRERFLSSVCHVADHAMLPLGVGGQIRSLDDVKRVFSECPADKVVIERHLRNLAEPAALKYGKQSVVAGVTEGRTLTHLPGVPPPVPLDYVAEVFVQSVERDGSLRGYPIDFAKPYLDLGIPVILGSGCEGFRSMLAGFEAGADACSTSNIHHFTPTTMRGIKAQLLKRGIALRDDFVQKMPHAGHAAEGAVHRWGM